MQDKQIKLSVLPTSIWQTRVRHIVFSLLLPALYPGVVNAQIREQIIFYPVALPVADTVAGTSNINNDELSADIPDFIATAILQTDEAVENVNRLNQLQAELSAISIAEGAYSSNLIDGLVEISHYYKQQHEFDSSVESLETARQLTRISFGLESETQIPILRELAESLKLHGNADQSRMELTRLMNLQYRHSSGSPEENAAYTVEYAQKLFGLAEHAYHHKTASPEFIRSTLRAANVEYGKGIGMLSRFVADSAEQIDALNRDRVRVNYLTEKVSTEDLHQPSSIYSSRVTRTDFHPSVSTTRDGRVITSNAGMSSALDDFFRPMTSYGSPLRSGESILQSEIVDARTESSDTETLAGAMLNLADWYLMTGYQFTNDAHKLYEEVYTMLDESGLDSSQSLISEKYQPAMPVQIPAFIPHDYTLESYEDLNGRSTAILGHIDVSFMIDRNGHAKRIKTTTSPELNGTIENMLITDLQRNQYRPRYENNEPVRKNYSLRYYVALLN